MADLSSFVHLVPLDHGLCVMSTVRADGSIHSTVVNAGVMRHPLTGEQCVALVAAGGTRKLAHLRATSLHPRRPAPAGIGLPLKERPTSLVLTTRIRGGYRHAAPTAARNLQAAGGTHDDWGTYDRVMAEERRAAVLIRPSRCYSNPTG